MRTFLDGILSSIGSESLTDVEYEGIPEGLTQDYTIGVYEALKTVVQDREGLSGQLKRLKAFFESKGLSIDAAARTASSQIFIGRALQ